jgi:hypothetical protein
MTVAETLKVFFANAEIAMDKYRDKQLHLHNHETFRV